MFSSEQHAQSFANGIDRDVAPGLRPMPETVATTDDAVPEPLPLKTEAVPLLERLTVDDREAGALFGKSRSWWRRLQAKDECPAPCRIGGATVWRVSDLTLWSENGFPHRSDFELLRSSRTPRPRRTA